MELMDVMDPNLVGKIHELTRRGVYIKDKEHANRVLAEILHGGFQRLHLVSEFHSTICKQYERGKRHWTSYSILNHCASVTREYKTIDHNLYHRFQPKTKNISLDIETRIALQAEWNQLAFENLCTHTNVTLGEIDETVAKLQPSLRDGSLELFTLLDAHNVPVSIFSAGLGDVVESILKYHSVNFQNVKVVSNCLQYNKFGQICGFKGTPIHVLNKNMEVLKGTEYHDLIVDRDNIILMGGMLSDANMADGVVNSNHILKIGFLNGKIDENLPLYMDQFDVVLVNDQTMDVVKAIIKQIRI